MHILFVYPKMFHPHRGGIERVSDLLCREFIRRGHTVFFLHNIHDESIEKFSYPAPAYFFPCSDPNIRDNVLFLQNFLVKHQIDIIINQDPLSYCGLFCSLKRVNGVHIISVIHSNPLYIYNHLFALTMRLRDNSKIEKIKRIARIVKIPQIKLDYMKKLKLCYKQSFAFTDLICLLSLKYVPELKRIYQGDMSRVIAIGNPNTYEPRDCDIQSKKHQLLYVGRVEWYQKRVDRLINIWKRVYKDFPDWELIIVGDGSFKQKLEECSSSIHGIRFVGYQNPEHFYKEASILCLTSDFEGWGMALTEAMTFGTVPILYNSYAAAIDIIENGKTGILVPPFSQSKYIYKLKELMKNKGMREIMAQNAMESVKRFDIHHVADQWEDTFYNLQTKE